MAKAEVYQALDLTGRDDQSLKGFGSLRLSGRCLVVACLSKRNNDMLVFHMCLRPYINSVHERSRAMTGVGL